MTDKQTPASTDALAEQVETAQKKSVSAPPVHLWNPDLSGDIDIRIARDGSWYHEGTRFERQALVKLFASILKKEGDEYFLVTPVEKWRLQVEDAPFVATLLDVEGAGQEQCLALTTQVEDRVDLDAAHPLRVSFNDQGEPSPYVMIRRGMEALISRNVYYQLVELAVEHEYQDRQRVGVWSAGQFFPLDEA